MIFDALEIEQVTKVTSQAIEVVFHVPQDLKESFKYQSGQYLTLKSTIAGKEVRRAYSISSAPHENKLAVVIKAVENGTFSTHAMSWRAGHTIDVATPDGLFIHTKATSPAAYLFIAAGSGITPIISIIKEVLKNEPQAQCALIYGNQSVAQTIYQERLNDLHDQYDDRFVLKYCYSREERDNALFGRINKANLNYFLKQDAAALTFSKAYCCGPEKMINMAVDNLVSKEILEKDTIYYELFTTTSADIEITEDSNLTELTVILDEEELVVTHKRDEALLDVMLRNDIDAPYSCQGGICSSCICQVESGSATMAKNAILTDSEIADGLTLACQARATTERIRVNFDEV